MPISVLAGPNLLVNTGFSYDGPNDCTAITAWTYIAGGGNACLTQDNYIVQLSGMRTHLAATRTNTKSTMFVRYGNRLCKHKHDGTTL
jgi:hypothetical protein